MLNGFSQNTFFKNYKDNTANFPGDMVVLESGNVLIPSITQTDSAWNSVLYKFDQYGDTLVTTKMYILNNQYAWIARLHNVGDGRILAFGSSYSGDSSTYDLWVLNMDTSFNVISEKIYETGLGAINMMNSITDCWGNHILFCSEASSTINSKNFIHVFNDTGDTLLSNYYQAQNTHYAFDILQSKDSSGYYLTGLWPSLNPGTAKTSIVKVKNNFNVDRLIGHTNSVSSNCTKWLNDSIFLSVGQQTNPLSDTASKVGVSIIDTSGNILGGYDWGTPDTTYQPAVQNNIGFYNGRIYFAGTLNTQTPPFPINYKTWIVLNVLDSSLTPIWQKIIGGDKYYFLYSIQVLEDGSCLLVGQANDFMNGEEGLSLFLAKIGPNGEFLSNHEMPNKPMEIKVYPNPGHDYFMLDVQLNGKDQLLELYNMAGVLCHSQALQNGNNRIGTQTLAQGMYVYKVVVDGKTVLSERWVKE